MSPHTDRRRAESFGADAAGYDRARPTYPTELIDDLMVEHPERVLDIGCGTGIEGRLLAARGCEVIGVEPDARMATVARGYGIDVDVSPFESWSPRWHPFDLVVCGQAWHWVDPAVGPAKVGDLLVADARFAAFWNLYRHDPEVQGALDGLYAQWAPEIVEGSLALGREHDLSDEQTEALRTCERFADVEWRTYPWSRTCTSAEWVDEMATHSDHRLLPATRLANLLDGLRATIDGLGGSIVVRHETKMLTALRCR